MLFREDIQKVFFSLLFASFRTRSFKYSHYTIGKALPYLNPSGSLATWPDAFSYTGGAVRGCLSPSSRFSLERCTFHPSPAGASHRASRNTSFKRCNFCEWRTQTLEHQTPHSEGAITKGESILDIGVQGGKRKYRKFKRAVLHCCV